MSPNEPKIIFMGTPEIAAYVLEKLVANNFNITAVVTSHDRPAGRGRKMKQSDVKRTAIKHNLKLLQPENLSDPKFINEINAVSPDVLIVVAFRKIPAEVWKLPPLGTFNLHASFLPNYRGAAPINRVLMNGEKQTGVTTFLIDKDIDSGKILLREKIDIDSDETAGSLHEKIKTKGAELVIKTINGLSANKLKPIDQKALEKEYNNLKKAPKIYKKDCEIDWSKSCSEITNLVRGLNPVPGAFTELSINNKKSLLIKIFEVIPEKFNHNYPAKTIITDNKTFFKITTLDGAVNVKELQIPGKKRITTEEFLRGYRFDNE